MMTTTPLLSAEEILKKHYKENSNMATDTMFEKAWNDLLRTKLLKASLAAIKEYASQLQQDNDRLKEEIMGQANSLDLKSVASHSSTSGNAIEQVLEAALLGLGSAKAIIDETEAIGIDTADNGAKFDCYQILVDAILSVSKFKNGNKSKIILDLDSYEATNLRWLLDVVIEDLRYPIPNLHTGDWTGQIRFRLPEAKTPNCTRESIRSQIEHLQSLLNKDQAVQGSDTTKSNSNSTADNQKIISELQSELETLKARIQKEAVELTEWEGVIKKEGEEYAAIMFPNGNDSRIQAIKIGVERGAKFILELLTKKTGGVC